MRKTVLNIIILLTLISCNNDSRKVKNELLELTESTQIKKIDTINKYREDGTKEFEVLTNNGLKTGNKFFFDQNKNIIGFKHYENDIVNGYSLILNENTFRPKYLYETNKGNRDGVKVVFYENGVIQSFRTSDIYNYSQIIDFHKNGTIKSIGQ